MKRFNGGQKSMVYHASYLKIRRDYFNAMEVIMQRRVGKSHKPVVGKFIGIQGPSSYISPPPKQCPIHQKTKNHYGPAMKVDIGEALAHRIPVVTAVVAALESLVMSLGENHG